MPLFRASLEMCHQEWPFISQRASDTALQSQTAEKTHTLNSTGNLWEPYGIGCANHLLLEEFHIGVNIHHRRESTVTVHTSVGVHRAVTNLEEASVDIFPLSFVVCWANCFH